MSAEAIDRIVKNWPRLALTTLPSPLSPMRSLSRDYGQRLYCKRDDLTGFAFGGSASRKLEFLLADARQQKVDTLVAVGSVQSNFARVVAAAAAQMHMDCYLVLGGPMPSRPSGNVIIDELLGAQLKFCSSEDWNDWEEAQELLVEDLQSQGRHVYSMPLAGTDQIGILGYVAAFAELLRDFEDMAEPMQNLLLASGSGGMQAGLLVGQAISGWAGKIHGVSIAFDKVSLANEIYAMANQLAQSFGLRIDPRDIHVDDSFVAPGFSLTNSETLAAIERLAQDEGLFVDRSRSGKAAAAMFSYLDAGQIPQNENLCFLHSGGSIELFA